jgi:hypothetical protein
MHKEVIVRYGMYNDEETDRIRVTTGNQVPANVLSNGALIVDNRIIYNSGVWVKAEVVEVEPPSVAEQLAARGPTNKELAS